MPSIRGSNLRLLLLPVVIFLFLIFLQLLLLLLLVRNVDIHELLGVEVEEGVGVRLCELLVAASTELLVFKCAYSTRCATSAEDQT